MQKTARTLGPVICVDNATSKDERILYARVLIEMNAYGEFPNEIYLINEHDELVNQKVVYDSKPIFCRKCKEMDYTKGKCKMGEPGRRASKPKPRPPKEGKIAATVGAITKQSNAVITSVHIVSQAQQEPRVSN